MVEDKAKLFDYYFGEISTMEGDSLKIPSAEKIKKALDLLDAFDGLWTETIDFKKLPIMDLVRELSHLKKQNNQIQSQHKKLVDAIQDTEGIHLQRDDDGTWDLEDTPYVVITCKTNEDAEKLQNLLESTKEKKLEQG